MGQNVMCKSCQTDIPSNEAIHCHSMGTIEYECMDRSACSNKISAVRAEGKPTRLKVSNETAKLPKNEQLEKSFGIKFSDLTDTGKRFRDGSIHYICNNGCGDRYSWCFLDKTWSKTVSTPKNETYSDSLF